ncbi:MAG TPA: hypothetical protein VM262_09655 [Acidimicrobiales bacterium]|nr:hypothetical protein [Acidimicrobiales bacterium]
MSRASTTLRRLGRRYRALGLTLAASAALVAVTSPIESSPGLAIAAFDPDVATSPVVTVPPGATTPEEAAGAVQAGTGAPGAPGDAASAEGGPGSGPAATAAPKNCDPATGRVRFPSVYAPPCVVPVSDNGGATYQGVSGNAIKVVLYRGQSDPAVDALIRAAGASDSPQDVLATYRDWFEMFQTNFETYGRRVTLDVIDASGPSDDDAAARADAIKVATDMKPFAVIGGPAAFVDELASRGIVVITQLQRPIEYFADRAPFVYGTQMSSTQAFVLFAEYVGKRLAGRPARHAGAPALQQQTRSLGLVYLDTAEGIYKPGVDAFERELTKYGASLTDRISYEGDINRAQEQSRLIISRLKDKGVTSVLFSGDPVAPIFLTQEATAQNYHPEWVIPGGTLVDTNFFGRTYDQDQWSHAFGVSQLWIRPPQEQTEPYYQHVWQFGRPPAAKSSYEILYQEPWVFFHGIHMAGANLNPRTFRDGLFSLPVGGAGLFTQVQRSFGRAGGWPFDDWTGFDTVTEVWWDPSANGSDEVGNVGAGMFQFVDGGRRYAPGQWSNDEPAVFDPSRSMTHYESLPPNDQYPTYAKGG